MKTYPNVSLNASDLQTLIGGPLSAADTPRPANKGWFKKGDDPRRHKFTTAECQQGFWRAIESVVARYPNAVMSDGRHIVVNFLPAMLARKGA